MHTSYEESVRANYERMDDAELLNIARERDDLTCTAQRLLAVELEKRGITNSQIQVSTNERPAKSSMSASYEESVRANYERMDDADLSNILRDWGDLTSTAQRLLAVELEKRGITASQIPVSVDKCQANSSINPVREHARLIFQLAAEAGDATRKLFQKDGEELSTQAWFAVVMEYHNLYLHLTDRAIFGGIPETTRQLLVPGFSGLCIDAAVSTICQGWGDERIAKIQKECRDNYKTSGLEYGVCKKLFPEKGEGTGGTMIWEFSKTVAGMVGHDLDIAYIMFFTQLIDLKRLNLKKFIESASNL